MELVRISTAGSVDDGKSTLIGRLLYDHGALTVEQQELVDRRTREKGWENLDLSVVTDGLTAEREQGITIDVAHMYFSTTDRKFIVSDSPGHVEYTRNMVTGASGSDVSIILIDARKGLLEQSFRHFFISHLLRVPRIVFCVNKMDLVDYSEDRFLEVARAIQKMVDDIGEVTDYAIVPVSSLKGDNVVQPSDRMPWYKGKTLDDYLYAQTPELKEDVPFRLDIQQVIHSQSNGFTDYRAIAGRVKSGTIRVGDPVCVLPGGTTAQVKEIRRFTQVLDVAGEGDSIALSLTDELDTSRGALLVGEKHMPEHSQEIKARLVWMDERPAREGARLLLKSGAREVLARLKTIDYLIDPVDPASKTPTDELVLNSIALVEMKTAEPLFLDVFAKVMGNGVFIAIDEQSNATVAVGFAD